MPLIHINWRKTSLRAARRTPVPIFSLYLPSFLLPTVPDRDDYRPETIIRFQKSLIQVDKETLRELNEPKDKRIPLRYQLQSSINLHQPCLLLASLTTVCSDETESIQNFATSNTATRKLNHDLWKDSIVHVNFFLLGTL